jgi:signal transduction histidine kinase
MFAAVVTSDYLARWDMFAPIVATYLSRMADSILSDELTGKLQEQNRMLDVLVQQRTKELDETAAELAESQKIISCAASVTQLLLAPADFDSAMHRGVVILGQATHSDRVCFVQSPSPGIAGVAEVIQWLSGEAESDSNPDILTESWAASLREGHTLLGNSGKCEAAEQAWLERRSVRTLLAIPIVTGELYWGFLRFDACAAPRQWSPSEMGTLSTICSNMGLAFRRELQARQLQAAKESAEVANRAKDRFLATISHELRTPLNAVLGYTQSLLQHKSLSASEIDQIKVIHHSAEHLLMLINDLLDLAKADMSRIELAPTAVNIRQLASNATKMVLPRAEEKGLALSCSVGSGVPEVIEADERRLRQVLINLLGNAVKFTQKGSVRLEVSSMPWAIRFKVIDTGCGISPDEIPQLFRPFSQLGSASQKQEGSGLGLAISKHIIQTMGSNLEVQSELGKGSSFWFDLPVAADIELSPGAPEDAEIEFLSGSAWTLPEPERLARLHNLVTAGDILELQAEVRRWINESPEPNPLAQKLLELAGAFRIKAIRQILNFPTQPTIDKGADHD